MGHQGSSDGLRAMRLAHLRKTAAEQMRLGNYGAAAARFSAAIDLLRAAAPGHAAAAELRVLLANRSAAWLRAGRAEEAAADASAVIALAPRWAKGHWRLGKAEAAQGRWSQALDAFLAAWQCCEPGSAEADECEQQGVMLSITRLTRQQLADGLLQAVRVQQQQAQQQQAQQQQAQQQQAQQQQAQQQQAQQQQAQQQQVLDATAAAPSLVGRPGGGALVTTAPCPVVPAGAGPVACLLARNPCELAEGMFQLVAKSGANCGSSPGARLSPLHVLLARWLKHQAAGRRGARSAARSADAAAMAVEVQLLMARLALHLQRWPEAQAAAAAAKAALGTLVVPDEAQLLPLLLECNTTLGDACAAGARSTSAAGGGAAASTPVAASAAQDQLCRPAEAAVAFLAALDLLPASLAGAGHGSASSTALAHRLTAAAVPAEQLRCELQSKLTAVLELLSDAEAHAVWAAAGAGSGASGRSGGSRRLALMQLGLTAAQVEQGQVSLPRPGQAAQHPAAAAALVRFTILRGGGGGGGSGGGGGGSDSGDSGSGGGGSSSSGGGGGGGDSGSSGSSSGGLTGRSRVLLLSGVARVAGVSRLAVSLGRIRLTPGAQRLEAVTCQVLFSCGAAAAAFARLAEDLPTLTAAGAPELAAALLGWPAAAETEQGAAAAGAQVCACYSVQGVEVLDLQPDPAWQPNEPRAAPPPGAATAAAVAEAEAGTDRPGSGAGALAAPPAGELAARECASGVLALPYAHHSLVDARGLPLERPDKHPFGLTRVVYDARELPASEVWLQAADGSLRWRQTASCVLVQLLDLPPGVTCARQLVVDMQPQLLRVSLRDVPGEAGLVFEAQLARGIVPADSTWTLERHRRPGCHGAGGMAGHAHYQRAAAVAAAGGAASTLGAGAADGAASSPRLALRVAEAPEPACHLLLELAKLNLELHARPWQHSASWWPRLFADDAADVAWDDAPKDYTDLPPGIAEAAAAAAAQEEERRRKEQACKEERQRLQALVQRHKQWRLERLRQLREAAWRRARG